MPSRAQDADHIGHASALQGAVHVAAVRIFCAESSGGQLASQLLLAISAAAVRLAHVAFICLLEDLRISCA